MCQHLFGDMPSDIADSLVPCAAFGKICDQRVPIVVPTAGHAGFLSHVVPRRLQSDHWPGRILRPRFSKWKNVPFRSTRSRTAGCTTSRTPPALRAKPCSGNRPAFAGFRLAVPESDDGFGGVHSFPLEAANLGIPRSGFNASMRGVYRAGARRLSGCEHCQLLFGRVRVRWAAPNCEFQRFPPAQPHPDDVTDVTKQSEEEADFLVDCLRCRCFIEPGRLVLCHRFLGDIDDHRATQMPLDVTQGVLRKLRRFMSQPIMSEVFVRDFAQRSDALLTSVLKSVESFFEFPSTLLLRQSRDRLRGRFRGFPDPSPREEKLVPPDLATFEKRHTAIPPPPLVTLIARRLRQSQPASSIC